MKVWKRCLKHHIIFREDDKCAGCVYPRSSYIVLTTEEFQTAEYVEKYPGRDKIQWPKPKGNRFHCIDDVSEG
jgi:hypothetical protein